MKQKERKEEEINVEVEKEAGGKEGEGVNE